jgi:TniQ/Bacterial regulatory helix-turn-helix protein, lysR family
VTFPRTFPIRLAPLPGEALDSWLEALAHRLNVRLGDVLGDLGLAAPNNNGARQLTVPADWTIALREEEAARIAHATGADPQQLHDMTLMRFDGRALRIDQAKWEVNRHVLWGRPRGSRFCPECLADNGGRWPLTWRLGWSFACPIHHRLLADRCPGCGRVQRERPFSRHALPVPGRCGTRPSQLADPAIPAGCGQDLTRAETLGLPVGHPALAAQRLILETIESGDASFGPYATLPQQAMAALSDLRTVAGRILADLPAGDLPRWVPQDLAGAHLAPDHYGEAHRRALVRPGFMSPARAASTAVAVTAAFRVLSQPGIQQAGIVMRELVDAIRGELWQVSATSIDSWGRGISPVFRGVYLAALGPSLRPSDQLRHRTTSNLPALPTTGRAQVNRRARKIPAIVWPSWAVRLSPPDGAYPRILGPVLSSAVLLVGNRMDLHEAATKLGSVTDGWAISRLLQFLAGDPRWDAIATAVTRVAAYLDDNDVPVDYQRRRRLDYSGLLTPRQWLGLCRRTGVSPGQGRRDKIARCLLFARISGLPAEAAPDFDTRGGEAYFRAETARFAAIRTPELAAALDEAAREFLARHRLQGEPVTWHPPLSLLSDLDLPGPDPSLIDVARLHELVRERAHPVQHAAEVLDTTVDAVRVALDEHPAPAAPLTAAQARATGQVRHAARQVLTEKEFRHRYGDQHQSLYDIAKQTGFSRQVLTRLTAEYGIPLREGPQDYKRKGVIDRDWLLDQYVNRGRTLRDLAREKNMSTANMGRWAHLHQIPLRPRGGTSHESFLRTINQAAGLPAPIAKALTSPYAWQRLNRFAAATGYRTLREAAGHLGITQTTLAVHINRLERDIGGPLLQRAKGGRPMSPTPLGEQVIAALHRTSRPTR